MTLSIGFAVWVHVIIVPQKGVPMSPALEIATSDKIMHGALLEKSVVAVVTIDLGKINQAKCIF